MIRINLRDFNESSFPIFPCYCSLVVSWLLPSCIYCSTIGGVCSKMTRTITLSIILYWTILLEIIPESTSNKTTLWNKSQRREGCFRQNVTVFFGGRRFREEISTLFMILKKYIWSFLRWSLECGVGCFKMNGSFGNISMTTGHWGNLFRCAAISISHLKNSLTKKNPISRLKI